MEHKSRFKTWDLRFITSIPAQEAQSILVKLGYDVGPSDGKIGPKTRSALQRCAAIEHLDFDGGVSGEMLTVWLEYERDSASCAWSD